MNDYKCIVKINIKRYMVCVYCEHTLEKENDMTFSFLGTSQKKGEGLKREEEEERSGGNGKDRAP